MGLLGPEAPELRLVAIVVWVGVCVPVALGHVVVDPPARYSNYFPVSLAPTRLARQTHWEHPFATGKHTNRIEHGE
jgi:hypothetical protein